MVLQGPSSPEVLDLNTNKIREWRSIVTLVVFVVTNASVLFPYHIPIFIPRALHTAILDVSRALRVIDRPCHPLKLSKADPGAFVLLRFPMDCYTAPLVANLFLLAILAIGKKEVHDGTIGARNIVPYDIMLFFLSLAYIAISVDASGLIKWLSFKVLQRGGKAGHRLFFYLYAFFFGLTAFIGNDPIILSGTAFLSYMTRASSNIKHPRAWIYTQFSVANIASAILVSSNPTNLVIAGAFQITFIKYTANVIVPVVVTGIVLFPSLLYIIFRDESLIPSSIKMEDLPEELKNKTPVNPNIPYAKGNLEERIDNSNSDAERETQLSLEEILNPYLDRTSAMFGAVLLVGTLITVLVLNAVPHGTHERPIYWVTLPAAFIMCSFDLTMGWLNREETRKIAFEGRRRMALIQKEQAKERRWLVAEEDTNVIASCGSNVTIIIPNLGVEPPTAATCGGKRGNRDQVLVGKTRASLEPEIPEANPSHTRTTLVSTVADAHKWAQETFPTSMVVFHHLPLALVPFAFCMFVLVQALVTKGWVPVLAYGWDHWVDKTGTVGAIGGMGFISVILCNSAGTNIGTTILLSRIIQAWQEIHHRNGMAISNRTFWGTVYSMAIGVNYGAFSLAFSASLAGLLWRDILSRKHIHVRSLDFARVNFPIITITMVVGLAVLTAQVYIIRDTSPYHVV